MDIHGEITALQARCTDLERRVVTHEASLQPGTAEIMDRLAALDRSLAIVQALADVLARRLPHKAEDVWGDIQVMVATTVDQRLSALRSERAPTVDGLHAMQAAHMDAAATDPPMRIHTITPPLPPPEVVKRKPGRPRKAPGTGKPRGRPRKAIAQ